MFKKDSLWLGVIIGILAPAAFYGLLFLVNILLVEMYSESLIIRQKTMLLLSIFINLIPIRIYFVNFKMDKTGRGVLLVTFALMILFFTLVRPLR
jgi:hypothetical protein